MKALVFSSAMLLSAIASTAATANPIGTPSHGEDKRDRMVCKTTQITGTRFEKRICKPYSQWRVIEERSMAAAREIQGRPQFNCTNSDGSPCGVPSR